MMNGKNTETEIFIQYSSLDFNKTWWSEATTLFDVQRWTFDVGRSSLKNILTFEGIKVSVITF